MLKEVSTPNFGLNFLQIAREYSKQTRIKNKLTQAIKINIFSVCAIEAIANLELSELLQGKKLDNFIRYKNICKKWSYILKHYKLDPKKISSHLNNVILVTNERNGIVHFKPHKNQTEKILIPAKKMVRLEGKEFTSFRKTGFKIIKNGILNKISLTKAKRNFKKINELIFDFYNNKKTWPNPKFCNEYWKTKSPFWKYRNKYL